MTAHVGRHLNSEFPDDRYRSTRSAASVSSLVILTQTKFRMVQVRIDNLVKYISTDVRRKIVDQ